MPNVINISVVGAHTLRTNYKGDLAVGSNNFDQLVFTLEDTAIWSGYTLYGVVYQTKDRIAKLPLDSNNSCKIPLGALEKAGRVFVGLRGEKSDDSIGTSNMLVFNAPNGAVDGSVALTPSEYEDIKKRLDNLEKGSGTGATKEDLSDIVNQYFKENPVTGVLSPSDREKLDSISINDTVITVNPSGGQEVELLTTLDYDLIFANIKPSIENIIPSGGTGSGITTTQKNTLKPFIRELALSMGTYGAAIYRDFCNAWGFECDFDAPVEEPTEMVPTTATLSSAGITVNGDATTATLSSTGILVA